MSYDRDFWDGATEAIDKMTSRIQDKRDRSEFLRDLAEYAEKEAENIKFDVGEAAWAW